MTAVVLPRTLETRAQFFPDDGPRTLETREEAPAPRPARGAAIVLLAASECPEYDGTRCVMNVLYRPGWSREEARQLLSQLPAWTAPHFIPVSDPDEWAVPEPPGQPGEHSPLRRARRRLRQMLDEMEAEIGELRGEDDYTAQQAKAEAYQAALDVLDEMFGPES